LLWHTKLSNDIRGTLVEGVEGARRQAGVPNMTIAEIRVRHFRVVRKGGTEKGVCVRLLLGWRARS